MLNESECNNIIDALIALSAKSLIDEDLEMMQSADTDDIEVSPRIHQKILQIIRKSNK